MALLLLACLPAHLLTRLFTQQSRWPRRFLAGLGWIAGARVERSGQPVRAHCLLLANHISWLDILILANATGCRFVSKAELGHALLIWLADQNRTIYVKRSQRRGSKDQASEIARALDETQPVAVFPEGTIGGAQLLPFRSTLLEAVWLTDCPVEVRPVAIDYGAARADLEWLGESGVRNAIRVLGRRGTIHVKVQMLDPISPATDRKQLAAEAHQRVAAALAASSSRAAGL